MSLKLGLSLYAAATLLALPSAGAQGHAGMDMGNADQGAHEAMAEKMAENPHMRMTPLRPRTVVDSVRAMAIADTLRAALAQYADPAAAERAGFRLFAPKMKNPKVYHYTNRKYALAAIFSFDPRKPTSILYKKDASGRMRLTGAMYTMPKNTSQAELDKRVPLSVTQWHLHTNLCVPRSGQERRYTELQQGKPLFGLAGTITTKAACDAENGKFTPVLFGWMVHANVFEGTDLETVWGHDDQKEHRG